MTKKEHLLLNNIIAENAMLREKLSANLGIYAETLGENVSLKVRIETMREVMGWPIGAEYEKT